MKKEFLYMYALSIILFFIVAFKTFWKINSVLTILILYSLALLIGIYLFGRLTIRKHWNLFNTFSFFVYLLVIVSSTLGLFNLTDYFLDIIMFIVVILTLMGEYSYSRNYRNIRKVENKIIKKKARKKPTKKIMKNTKAKKRVKKTTKKENTKTKRNNKK